MTPLGGHNTLPAPASAPEGTLSDRIFLEGIRFHGFHGLTRMEREVGVRLVVDISLEMDLEGSGRTDSVRETVDYRKVHRRVVEVGRGSSHKLLESFAVTLLDTLCAEFPVERMLRDARAWCVAGGTVQMLRITMASLLFGRRFDQRK